MMKAKELQRPFNYEDRLFSDSSLTHAEEYVTLSSPGRSCAG